MADPKSGKVNPLVEQYKLQNKAASELQYFYDELSKTYEGRKLLDKVGLTESPSTPRKTVGKQLLQSAVEGLVSSPDSFFNPAVGAADMISALTGGGGATKEAQAIAIPGWLGDKQVGKVIKAQKLKKAGVSDESIYEQTGIYTDPVSGAAKRIVSDKDASLDLSKFEPNQFDPTGRLRALKSSEEMLLEDILYHPDLYRAMPELREVKVQGSFGGVGGGAFNAKLNKIFVDAGSDPDSLLRVILHETEHAANNVYGTGAGGSSKSFLPDPDQFYRERKILRETLEKTKQADPSSPMLLRLEELRKKFDQIEMDNFKKYERIGGEASARATEQMHIEQSWDRFPLKQIKHGGYYDVPIEELIASPLDK